MNSSFFRKAVPIAALAGMLSMAPVAAAADLTVAPDPTLPHGGHEIWANGEIGQSFVAPAAQAKGGFLVEYSPESAALMPPNNTVTQMTLNLYTGESMNPADLLATETVTVDSTQNGFLDTDFAAKGVTFTVGNTYTIGIASPYNRGWVVPSVCTYPANAQPTGAYDGGHPFFQSQIVTDETGICDNGFHMTDLNPSVTPAPTPTPTVTPTVTPTPDPVPTATTKKAEGKGTVTAVAGNSITVNRTVVYYTAETVINLNYQPEFAVGQKVHYTGFKNTDRSVTATYIEVK